MKKIICFLLTLSLAFSLIGSAFAADEKVVASFIYVSPNGSDTADGSIKTPYKTLEKAIEAAKATKEFAFNTLGAKEVCSIIRDTNTSSMRVAIRNGMLPRDTSIKHYKGVDMLHIRFVAEKGL